jgi:hypothetical protein
VGKGFCNVPHERNPYLTGREEAIAGLRAGLAGAGKTGGALAISGLGGVGKTQTAVEYAYRYRRDYYCMLWMDAESSETLNADCARIGKEMKPPVKGGDDIAVEAVWSWLRKHAGWLLILDNGDDPAILERLLPKNLQGHILITSRARDFQRLGIIKPVELAELPLKDATDFLLRRCERKKYSKAERAAARSLAAELGGLPLALEQAAAYIVAREATFQDYLESYQRGPLAQLRESRPALGRYPESVVSTWAVNFGAVLRESAAAADVLRLSAFLAADLIPFELLVRGAPQLGPILAAALAGAASDPLVVNNLLAPLIRYSLIRVNRADKSFSIHRMVQQVLKAAMDEPTRLMWGVRTSKAVELAFSSDIPVMDRVRRKVPQLLAQVSEIVALARMFGYSEGTPDAGRVTEAPPGPIPRSKASASE